MRDYLYIPLGGNRGGTLMTSRNLFVTMLLGGLWHGAGYTFLIWGALHGFYLVLQRLVTAPYERVCQISGTPGWLSGLVAIAAVFGLTCLGWIFFRAGSLADALRIIEIIASFQDMTLHMSQQLVGIVKTVLIAGVVLVVDWISLSTRVRERYMASPAFRCAGVLALGWAMTLFGTFEGSSFLYFQF